MSVIRGAAGCLASLLAIQVELSVRHVYSGSAPYLDALSRIDGYELTGIFSVQRDSTLRVVNLDCVLIRKDAAERLRSGIAASGTN